MLFHKKNNIENLKGFWEEYLSSVEKNTKIGNSIENGEGTNPENFSCLIKQDHSTEITGEKLSFKQNIFQTVTYGSTESYCDKN